MLAARDAEALDAFSLAEPDAFWRALWAFTELPGNPGARDRSSDGTMAGTRFFPDGRVNFTEALLRGPADALAILARDETGAETHLTRGALRDAVATLAAQLKEGGFGPGDRLCALTPNRPEAVIAALATAALGGTFASCSPDFAPRAVLDRFAPLRPKALLVSDGSRYKGRALPLGETAAKLKAALNPALALSYAVLGTGLEDFTPLRGSTPGAGASWRAADRGALDPLYVLFSSGTTGAPKGIIHGTAGPLLQHLKEHQLHCDIGPGDRLLFYTTCGWMMWNWLVSALASGAAIGLYDGAPDAQGTGAEDAFLSFAREGALLTSAPPRPISRALPSWAKGLPCLRSACCCAPARRSQAGPGPSRSSASGTCPSAPSPGVRTCSAASPWANPSAPWKPEPCRGEGSPWPWISTTKTTAQQASSSAGRPSPPSLWASSMTPRGTDFGPPTSRTTPTPGATGTTATGRRRGRRSSGQG